MPRPRASTAATGQKAKHFEVMPWQSKRIKTAEEPATADSENIVLAPDVSNADGAQQKHSEQPPLPSTAEVLHQIASLLAEKLAQEGSQGDVSDTDIQPGMTAPEEHTIEEVVICDSPTAQEPERTQEELLRQCSFDEYELPPLQPARAQFTHHASIRTDNTRHSDSQQVSTAPLHNDQGAGTQPHLSQPALTASISNLGTNTSQTTRRPSNTKAAVLEPSACQQDKIEGRCRLAMLPGRLGWSGHVVDANTRSCVGLMAEKVGGSPQGDMCGMDDDEELLTVTLVRFSTSALNPGSQDIVTYVISCGGDMPRWKPAETAHLERYGLLDRDDTQRQLVQVSFECESLLEGPEADRQLSGFAKKLVGSGASVVHGQMRVAGLNDSSHKDS